MKLDLDTLAALPPPVERPRFDAAALRCGIVHLGLGAFHRAHQAVFTDEAIAGAGGDWGIVSVSMRRPAVAEALARQDGLYTVETLDCEPSYRVIGSIRRTLWLPGASQAVLQAIAAPNIHVVTLTVTETGYCLVRDALDTAHPDIVHDLEHPRSPRSAIGVLVAALALRRAAGGGPMTVISCDNLAENGARLSGAVLSLASRWGNRLPDWIAAHVTFPESVVDCIVPAATEESGARANRALGVQDDASVQRESFAQWVMEDRFAGPYPAWVAAGAQIVPSCAEYRRLKLHVLNAAHSALAYLGMARGHERVREAAADPAIAEFLERMIGTEIAPALTALDVQGYWKKTARRFGNPMLDHRLAQIAQDGAAKLSQRYSPLMLANLRSGLPYARMAEVYAAWLRFMEASGAPVDVCGLADPVWREPALRTAILKAEP